MLNDRSLVPVAALLSVLYLIPIYFVNIQTQAIDFDLRLQYVFYPMIFGVLFLCDNKKGELIKSSFIFVFVFVVNFIYMYFYGSNYDGFLFFGGTLVFSLMLVSTYVIYKKVPLDYFLRMVYLFSVVTILLVFISFFLYKISGLKLFVDSGYGDLRPHALMSEPSALSFVLSFLAACFFIKKQYARLSVVLFAALIAKSLIVLMSVFVSILLIQILESIRRRDFKVFFIGGVVSIVLIMYLVSYFPIHFEEQYYRLESGIRSVLTMGDEGYNPRMIIVVVVLDLLDSFDALLFGFGMNSATYLEVSNIEWRLTATSLPFYLLLSVGIFGAFIFYAFVAKGFLTLMRNKESSVSLISLYVSLFVVTTINAAQGLLIYNLFFLITLHVNSFNLFGKRSV